MKTTETKTFQYKSVFAIAAYAASSDRLIGTVAAVSDDPRHVTTPLIWYASDIAGPSCVYIGVSEDFESSLIFRSKKEALSCAVRYSEGCRYLRFKVMKVTKEMVYTLTDEEVPC